MDPDTGGQNMWIRWIRIRIQILIRNTGDRIPLVGEAEKGDQSHWSRALHCLVVGCKVFSRYCGTNGGGVSHGVYVYQLGDHRRLHCDLWHFELAHEEFCDGAVAKFRRW
jgi:hypothetical protein